jgi:hypothetical protein
MFKSLFVSLLMISSSAFAQFAAQTAEVNAFLATHEVSSVRNYCRADFLNCRSLIRYKSIVSGNEVESFEDRFLVSTNTRSVGARGFFMKQADGTFNVYGQSSFSNTIDINGVDAPNQGITVAFDVNDLPTFNVAFKIIGTNPIQYKTAELSFSAVDAVFTGDINFTIPFVSETIH